MHIHLQGMGRSQVTLALLSCLYAAISSWIISSQVYKLTELEAKERWEQKKKMKTTIDSSPLHSNPDPNLSVKGD